LRLRLERRLAPIQKSAEIIRRVEVTGLPLAANQGIRR
jgi:hypothetical protein